MIEEMRIRGRLRFYVPGIDLEYVYEYYMNIYIHNIIIHHKICVYIYINI